MKQVLKNEKSTRNPESSTKKAKIENDSIDMIANPMGIIQQISSVTKAAQKEKRQPSKDAQVPIIIVPAAISSLITLYNAKELLENEKLNRLFIIDLSIP